MRRPLEVARCSALVVLLLQIYGCGGGDSDQATLGAATTQPTMGSSDSALTGDPPGDGSQEDSGPDDGANDGPDDGQHGGNSTDDDSGGAATSSTGATMSDDTGTGGPATPPMLLHLNVDGAFLTQGPDDAPNWVAASIGGDADIPAHTDATRAMQILDELEVIVAPYPIEIVTEDPGLDATYTMVVLADISPATLGFPSGVVSVGPVDCGDDNPNNVLVAMDDPTLELTSAAVANSIAWALGVAVGLNTNSTPGDAMNSAVTPEPASFTDACVEISTKSCPVLAASDCEAGEQNSHQALMMALEG